MTVRAPRGPRLFKEPDPKYMTLVEHLDELRQRLVICSIAIVAGSVGGWFLVGKVIQLLDKPLCQALPKTGCRLVVTQPYGGFTLNLKIAIILGFAFALPVTIYQVWGFVAPAFGPKPNKYAPVWMTSALGLFAGGAVVGYFVIPLAINFFAKFQGSHVEILPFASDYISFVVLIIAIFGISFELPLVLVSLTAVGITSSRWLSSKRAYFFFGIFAAATVITPGADWISPLILGGMLYVLFEIAVLVSRFMGK